MYLRVASQSSSTLSDIQVLQQRSFIYRTHDYNVFLDVLIVYSHSASSNQIQNETNQLHHSMKSNNDHPSHRDQLESAITVSCDDKYKPNHLVLTKPAYAAPNLWGSIGIGVSPADLGIRSSATFHGYQWVSNRSSNSIRNNTQHTTKQHIEYTSKSNNHNEIHTPQIIQAIIPSNTHRTNKKQQPSEKPRFQR